MTTRKPAKTSAKAPAGRRTSSRTGTKRATPYDEATKAKALAQLEAEGMAATHAATGIPKGSLGRWAKAAGIDLGEQARARTARAAAATAERGARVRLSTVELLEHHIAEAGTYLSTIAGVNAQAAELIADLTPDQLTQAVGMAGPYAVIVDEAAQQAATKALALAGLPLAPRDAEGILTRAIHDLQLLKGEATERGELVVEFNVPRPDPGTTVVEQDALGIEAP